MEYNAIKNIDELLERVKLHGLATDSESICKAQDILAYTEQDVLDEIMGGDYRSTLLHVMFRVLDCDMATRFYNRHNGVDARFEQAEEERREVERNFKTQNDALVVRNSLLEKELEKAMVELEQMNDAKAYFCEQSNENYTKAQNLHKELQELKPENERLKEENASLKKLYEENKNNYLDEMIETSNLNEILAEKDFEILKLKAKLYDLMMKEGE